MKRVIEKGKVTCVEQNAQKTKEVHHRSAGQTLSREREFSTWPAVEAVAYWNRNSLSVGVLVDLGQMLMNRRWRIVCLGVHQLGQNPCLWVRSYELSQNAMMVVYSRSAPTTVAWMKHFLLR